MLRGLLLLACVSSLAIVGCGGSDPNGDHDSGHVTPGMDGGGGTDAFVSGRVDVGAGLDGGCIPTFEICGDHIDQDCNGHDASCGDNDHDSFQACRADADLTMCDCDDTHADTYPPHGTLPGGAEACDGRDNDCDGRIDEAAACCPACMALGETTRGDVCTVGGACACSTAAGMAVCPAGQTCCASGCVDTATDLGHCGSCTLACTNQSDRCLGGECFCGAPPGVACTFTTMCHNGACM